MRIVSEKDYSEYAKTHQNALNYPEVTKTHHSITDKKHWAVIAVKEDFKYQIFHEKKVLIHWLILPHNNSIENSYGVNFTMFNELKELIRELKSGFVNLPVIIEWKEAGKSVKKFHIRFIVLENGK